MDALEAKKWKVRTIRENKSGIIKRYTRESAAKRVFSGAFEYVDDGPDDIGLYEASWNKKTFREVENTPSDVVNMLDLKISDPDKDKNWKGARQKRKIDMSKLSDSQRKTIRAQSSSPEVAPPMEAAMSRGISGLKEQIQRVRAKRDGAA